MAPKTFVVKSMDQMFRAGLFQLQAQILRFCALAGPFLSYNESTATRYLMTPLPPCGLNSQDSSPCDDENSDEAPPFHCIIFIRIDNMYCSIHTHHHGHFRLSGPR